MLAPRTASHLAVACLGLVACAQGGAKKQPGQGIDASVGPSDDAPVSIDGSTDDGEPTFDAPMHPIDAAGPDAAMHPVDAANVMPDACVPQTTELLANPAFDLDAGGTGWTQVPIANAVGGPYYPITNDGPTPHSAPYHVFLGGLTGQDTSPTRATVTDQVYQDVAIPAGTTQLVLSGYYIIGSMEPNSDGMVYDRAELALIETSGAPIEVAHSGTNLTEVAAWTAFSHTFANVGALAGRTVRVRMTSTNDDSYNSNFFYDTLSLKATHCP